MVCYNKKLLIVDDKREIMYHYPYTNLRDINYQ